MTRIEYRAVIKFLTLEGNAPIDIHQRLVIIYGDSAPSYATVKNWVGETRRGRVQLQDGTKSGRLVEVTTKKNVDKVRKILEDRRITL